MFPKRNFKVNNQRKQGKLFILLNKQKIYCYFDKIIE